MRVSTLGRGIALLGLSALVATLVLVIFANALAFSSLSVIVARVVLFLIVAFAIGLGVVLPLMRLNRRRAARKAEELYPAFEERLLTFAESGREDEPDPFLELLADDALPVIRAAEPERVVTTGRVAAFFGAALATIGTLVWLTVAGPGFLGYGSSLLWAGAPSIGKAPFYDIRVFPGDQTLRRGGDQLISAHLLGFQAQAVRLFARFESGSKWEEVPMQPEPGGTGYEFLFAGIPEPVDYYVEAGRVRTRQFRLSVVDLPKVRRIQVTYRYPTWLRKSPETEEDGGDLRAVEGTKADLLVETDKPLAGGFLLLDDGQEISLGKRGDTLAAGTIQIEKDGLYYVAVRDGEDTIRLSEDFFIEAQPEEPPSVRIRRPGRDYRASPIEEVTVAVEAEDDFGLQDLSLRYSVNGGEEQAVKLLRQPDAKEANAGAVLYLEDYNLVPGDLISMYAVARDARASSRTGMFFIEAQPFEREYRQSQQSGGMGGGQQEQNRISARQKEIIAATWNQINDTDATRAQAAENATLLSEIQTKLKEQALSLAKRMRARQLSVTNEEFESFAKNMERAAQAMEEATGKLKGLAWRASLPPEQKALQHLLRAESIFRQIQVARGGAGGSGGNMGRDLESLFDLELDTEKNQYETGQRAASGNQRAREIDEALQKLKELARRQQELAEQQKKNHQTSQQRWQQEMLRREAERLKKKMEELARQSDRLQRGQSSSSQQQQGRRGQQGQQGQQGAIGNSAGERRLQQSLERLRQATEDMRRSSSSRGQSGNRQANSRRAAERLQEATELLSRLRKQESSNLLSDIAERAQRLSDRQRSFAEELREAYKNHRAITGIRKGPDPAPPSADKIMKLAEEKRAMAQELRQLEHDMQQAVRDLAGSQPAASSKLRQALGEMQQNELSLRMKYLSDWISRGLGAYAWLREAPVTQGMRRLADQTRQAEAAVGKDTKQESELARALTRVEDLRNQLEQLTRGSHQQGQQGGRSQGKQQGQQGQQGQRGQQGEQGQQGQQGKQGQQGQQGQRGQGNQMQPSQRNSPFGGAGRGLSAMNTGERDFNPSGRTMSPEDYRRLEQSYRAGMRDLSRLRSQVRDNRDVSAEIADLVRQMKQLDPSRFPGNPELVEELRTQVLPGLEQVELRLRRELGGDQAGQAKSVFSDRVPPGYADAVAEYFRKLSQGK